jgi:hypothetical protein
LITGPLPAPVHQGYQSPGNNSITIMTGVKEDFVIPFTGALQASLAVLLTIFYGVIAAQFDMLTEKSAKDISKACVRLFLPALLIVNVGQQLSLESVSDSAKGERIEANLSVTGNKVSGCVYLGYYLQCA